MPLPSFLKRKDPSGTRRPSPEDTGPVEAARTKARRRLIGAVVLLLVGIIVFPLVFETQPRPISPNTPIETPRHERELVLPAPPARVAQPATRASAPVVAEAPPDSSTETAASAPTPVRPTPAPTPTPVAHPAPPVAAPTPVARAEDSKRARALLEGDAASQAKTGRYVVQVGAYTDANALREVRQKVEKLGLKTYTQVVETEAGKRTRVRVGPFSTREEADGAGAKLKGAGLPAAVLTL